ncbi:hypothetical protein K1T71_009060 [Dendrolimus kikuchii]|uniref:Uncharacterized protein n=1 Tax=Dendrolimus kikuchii TaxID=765133 RepID=A0ACC1CTE8_9NEOP|nr:hypothetical protein K1T71_009060 [Dendrolimus kikuchii]
MVTVVVVLVTVAIATLYAYATRNFRYWAVRGVRHDRPTPLFGNFYDGAFMRKSVAEIVAEIYWKYPHERIVGFFSFNRPELIIRDPAIVKRIIQTDFAYFYPRGLNSHDEVIEPLMQNLFFADGDLWKLLRQRMTPAFTSGKLKAMFPLIEERAERLRERATAAAAEGRTFDARDLMARYTTDFIGACGFGLDTDSLNDEHSEFRRLGVDIFKVDFRKALTVILKDLFPETCKYLRIMADVESRLSTLVRSILKQRNYKPSRRNDFVDLLLECREKGLVVGESLEKFDKDGSPARATLDFSEDLIAAQIFVFFAAGFETSSSATSFTLHQLAYHPQVQAKVHAEIDSVLARHGGKLSYAAVKEMKYLECAFKEGMRMFPSLGYLVRKCACPYTFADLEVSIEPGVRAFIPLQALHNDPQYFDSPEEFRPERFLPEQFDAEKYKYIYLPFGDGPRVCIGARLGLMQSLAGLAAVLAGLRVLPAPTTVRRPAVEPTANVVQAVRGGLPLLFQLRRARAGTSADVS